MNEKQIRDDFKLRLAGVEDGTYSFSISCKKEFFELAKISNIEDGDLKLQVEMSKTEKLVDVRCHFEGYVVAPCDRCLLPVTLPMDIDERLIVKLVPTVEEGENDDDDDIWVMDENTYELDIFQFVYESIFLAMPISVIHEDDENGNSTCDPEVLKKLEELSQKEEEKEKETDPRWDALKNLKFD
ncbi:MAG: DUF177 domain-containing protein [Bacteroidales bacterium]|nr:DUF177 domain-containing protein [Bacteroidales bacterium]